MASANGLRESGADSAALDLQAKPGSLAGNAIGAGAATSKLQFMRG